MEDFAKQIVRAAMDLGAQDAVADVVVDRDHQVRFARNEPVIVNRWRKTEAFVFLAYNRRLVTGQIRSFRNIPEQVEALLKVAKASKENPEYAGIAKGRFNYRRLAMDRRIADLEDGSDYVEAAIGGAIEEGAKECAGSFWRYDEEHHLNTSNGVSARDRTMGLYLSIRAFTTAEGSGHGVSCANRASQFDPESAGHKAGRIAALAKEPKPGKEGTYDVVFDPLIFGSLIYEVGDRASAYEVSAGLSPFLNKLGKKVASDAVTIVDDGTADTLGRRRFDDEGVPTKRKAIVRNGVLKTYLHNTSTAKKFKTRTTANAGIGKGQFSYRRSALTRLIAPHPHALLCLPGDRTRDELFNEVKDGLWLTNTWYTRYQSYVKGDFSTIPRDGIFHIRDGEIVEAWKDIRLTDNLIGLWKRVKGLSRTSDQVMWWGEVGVPTLAPYALVTNVGITKSAM